MAHAHDFASFRSAARGLVLRGVPPAALSWADALSPQADLFSQADAHVDLDSEAPEQGPGLRVPRRFVELAGLAVLVRSADRFALAYRLLYRISHGEPRLMDDRLDPDVQELTRRAQNVRKDEEHMRAFVRFRSREIEGVETFIAWYEPKHFIVALAAPFFQRRFASQRFSILTPDGSVFWDGETLHEGPGGARSDAPRDDELEALFRTYYAATFNPARTNLTLFQRHVPRAFQRHMPELEVLSQLPRPQRSAMPSAPPALVPETASWPELREAAARCRACGLGERATQTVFGVGPEDARLCLVGEQPGDEEDRSGHPFVGPAGQVLDRALAEAGFTRSQLYITNAVKHFSHKLQGKKRLHVRPNNLEVQACKPWLLAELSRIQPQAILCLGATAAQAFLGRGFSVARNRGRTFETPWARHFLVSYHPSAVLRAADDAASQVVYAALVEDL
ncbi:MAG TPA: UdgX family uracil-DNA binding protein, partial [Polyangiales bacterium]